MLSDSQRMMLDMDVSTGVQRHGGVGDMKADAGQVKGGHLVAGRQDSG